MGEGEHNSSRPAASWNRAFFSAWLAGALVPQVPFQRAFKLGNGGLGYNILIGVALVILGVILIAGLARVIRLLVERGSRESLQRRWTARLCGAAGVLSALALLPFSVAESAWKWLLGTALLLLAAWVVVSVITVGTAFAERGPGQRLRLLFPRREKRRWRFNGAFWLLVFLVFLTLDLLNLGQIKNRSGLESTVLILGRFLTLGTLTVSLLLLVQLLFAFFPAGMRWLVMAGAAIIPLVVIANYAAGVVWQQSLLALVNSFTFTGEIDMRRLLEGGGLEVSPAGLYLRIGALVLVSLLAHLALERLSRRFSCQTETSRALLVWSLLWLATIGEQALSSAVLRREIWQAEHSAFGVHLGVLAPDPGLETIPVAFVETQSASRQEALLGGDLPTLARKPDIYLVMVETWRADSITPEITPFLSEFRRKECQRFASTFASSNCTPVSWFSFFHSRLGIHWKETVEAEKAAGGLRGAYPLRLLHKLGYRMSVRAVCDLAYQEMGDCNFGARHALADEFRDNPLLPRGLNIPEREIIIVDDLKSQVLNTPPGGHFHFLSFDSPHYNYYWPDRDFEPLHRDCIGNPTFPANPSPEHIREIVKRYENSVNWIDHQIEQLVSFLKAENRFDDAIIVLTGDHGEDFQEFGTWYHCSNLKRPQTEVPLMIKWPKWLPGQPAQDQASHLDVMPSILDALGLEDKYFKDLAGRSLLRPHPGETMISTQWAGNSKITVCFVKEGLKANFRSSRPWSGNVPETLHFMGYSDLDDQPLDPLEMRGNLSHVQALRLRFPETTSRFFSKFGAR